MDGVSGASVLELARRQLDDYRSKTPGTWFGEDHPPLELPEAYAVQAEVARLRVAEGDAVAGFKIGCIGPKVLEQFGMSGPIRGILYRSEMRDSGARLSLSDFPSLAVEAEMAIRLGEDLTITEILPVIELHHFVFRRPSKTLAELVANNGLHAGVVMPGASARSAIDDTRARLSLVVDDTLVEEGALWGMAGGAERARDWLTRHLGEHGMALEPGHLILAGTPLGLHPLRPGQTVRAEAGSLGQAVLSVAP